MLLDVILLVLVDFKEVEELESELGIFWEDVLEALGGESLVPPSFSVSLEVVFEALFECLLLVGIKGELVGREFAFREAVAH